MTCADRKSGNFTAGVGRQYILDQPKTIWVATVELELSRQEGTRTIAIVMNASTFAQASDVDYFITNVDCSIVTAEWIVTTYAQRNKGGSFYP